MIYGCHLDAGSRNVLFPWSLRCHSLEKISSAVTRVPCIVWLYMYLITHQSVIQQPQKAQLSHLPWRNWLARSTVRFASGISAIERLTVQACPGELHFCFDHIVERKRKNSEHVALWHMLSSFTLSDGQTTTQMLYGIREAVLFRGACQCGYSRDWARTRQLLWWWPCSDQSQLWESMTFSYEDISHR